jgi:hypothetical protein
LSKKRNRTALNRLPTALAAFSLIQLSACGKVNILSEAELNLKADEHQAVQMITHIKDLRPKDCSTSNKGDRYYCDIDEFSGKVLKSFGLSECSLLKRQDISIPGCREKIYIVKYQTRNGTEVLQHQSIYISPDGNLVFPKYIDTPQ